MGEERRKKAARESRWQNTHLRTRGSNATLRFTVYAYQSVCDETLSFKKKKARCDVCYDIARWCLEIRWSENRPCRQKDKTLNSVLFTEVTNKHSLCSTCQSNVRISLPEACVQSLLSTIHIAFTVCNEICNINHYYLSCDLDVDIEIEEPIYHRLIWVTMHAA